MPSRSLQVDFKFTIRRSQALAPNCDKFSSGMLGLRGESSERLSDGHQQNSQQLGTKRGNECSLA